MASNYDTVVEQLRAGGLVVDHLRVSGRVVRCPVDGDREQRGWYVLDAVRGPDGVDIIVGSWGVWRGTDNGATPIAVDREAFTDEQRAAFKERMREDRRRAEQERKREAARAQRVSESSWRKALHTPPDDSVPDYLRRKGVGGHGIRYLPSGAIVLPMHDAGGKVHGLQVILSREAHKARIAKTGRDKEYWPPGLAKQGHWFQIGSPTAVCLIAEGYATAATLHEATGLPVAVAFDAGNLGPVAKALRKRYPQTKLLICADDDFATRDNPGVTSASVAAMSVSGAWVAPVFAVDDQIALRARIATEIDWTVEDYRERVGDILRGGRKLTDFNDLHAAEGLLTVRSQIEARLSELGWRAEGPSRATSSTGGEGRAADDWRFDLDRMLSGYALIYATDTVFDRDRRMVLSLGPLRSAAGKSLVRMWLEHPDRTTVLPEQVGFDPTGEDPAIKCNLWGGWPTKPAAGSCSRLLELLDYLCNWEPSQQRELADWLIRWIAYPIQHPGAKMQTAVLIHGPEGTGKNLLFGAICQIYGRYACNFGQSELESAFNGWMSAKLFAVGNEVVTRAEMYHTQGRLKDMVTGEDHHINEKMLPVRVERNRTNIVLNSNRPDIAKLDQGDRRYCVIWTPPALSAEFYRQVADELANGGAAALHHHLLHLDLGSFDRHTKPPLTRAKEDLVELGMDSTERFLRDWMSGNVADLPAVCCRSDDLYTAYRHWCQREGIGKPAQKQTLLTVTGKKPGVSKSQERYLINMVAEKKTVVLCPGHTGGPEDGSSRAAWIGKHVLDFSSALLGWRNATGSAGSNA